jgi:hypothetical protein
VSATQIAVRERPILFSAPMVRALLDDRKTQTRRVVVPQPHPGIVRFEPIGDYLKAVWNAPLPDDVTAHNKSLRCPYGAPGDRLWVRETWSADVEWIPEAGRSELRAWADVPPGFRGLRNAQRVYFAADGAEYEVYLDDDGSLYDLPATGARLSEEDARATKWRPSIHMPRWASRITLELTGVRVERVQDISEADARAEGCSGAGGTDWETGERDGVTPRDDYAALWDSLNAKRGYGWDVNPFVWVLDFRRLTPEAP